MPKSLPAGTAHWLEVCRRSVDADWLVKTAELGGDGQDTSFEQAFSNLAHAYLRDKAPSLLDHELGFQLVDRNQENTKAVGVFAFKVGSQRLFAPVFFLKGELKGHELLYLRNQDMFVPLKENWLNHILNRKPNILGSGISRQTSQIGVRQPDLNRLSQAPSKFASARFSEAVQPFLPVMAHLATQDFGEAVQEYADHCNERLHLGHFLKQASLPAIEAAVTLMQKKPVIAEAFERWHGLHTLSEAVKEASARLSMRSVLDNPYVAVNRNQKPQLGGSILDRTTKSAADGDDGPDYQQKIEVITPESSIVSGSVVGLDEEDQEKLMKDTVLIKDHRAGDEVSVPVNLQVEERLSNPTQTGMYQVLVKAGTFEKCLVITDPHGPNGRENFATVIRMDASTRNWGNFPTRNVWVLTPDEPLHGGEESWMEEFDDLPDTATVSANSRGSYVAVGPRRNATLPFSVYESISNEEGTKSYNVSFHSDCRSSGPVACSSSDSYERWRDGERIHIDAKGGTQIRSAAGDLYLPKNYKLMSLKPVKKIDGDSDAPCGCFTYGHSETSPIEPGNLLDATRYLMEKTSALKVAFDGTHYSVNNAQPHRFVDTLVHLVKNHNLREDDSRHILKEAQAKYRSGSTFHCRIKYASPFLTDGGPTAPAMNDDMGRDSYNPMGFQGSTQTGYTQETVIPEMSGQNTDPNIYNVNPANTPEPMDANGVNRAVQTGQREVFDTAMIGSMLKAVRDDTMIDRYLPDLSKGVDRLGRILFMFYWHRDKFADRYGKQDMPELEDSLRNAFEMMGDVILFLKQKTIEPYPEEDNQDVDLGDSANN